MKDTGASCYVYAKASGMLSKSYIGSNATNLVNVNSLQDLWTLLFDEELPQVPQTILAQKLERRAAKKFIDEYKLLLSNYSKPDEILVTLLQWFDYENIKTAVAELAANNDSKIDFDIIKPYNILNYEKWPDLKAMVLGTEFEWCDKVPELSEVNIFSNSVDSHFITKAWHALDKLPHEEKQIAKKVIAERYSLMNITWAMRLKLFYKMQGEEIKEHLIYIDGEKNDSDLFASDAIKILDYNVESYDDWAKWKYSKFINPKDESTFWKLDPVYFEKQTSKNFLISMKKEFHKNPFTSMVMISWFFIKRGELNNIKTVTESLRFGIDKNDMLKDIV